MNNPTERAGVGSSLLRGRFHLYPSEAQGKDRCFCLRAPPTLQQPPTGSPVPREPGPH